MHKSIIPFWALSKLGTRIALDYPHRCLDFAQSFSENQIMAKSWLVENLALHPIAGKKEKTIVVLGSWYGTLIVPLLYHYLSDIKYIKLIDYDKETLTLAKILWGDKIITEVKDISFDVKEVEADIIINTSCEHMWHMKDIQFKGVCAFQSNDFLQETSHVNCVNSIEEFIDQTGIQTIDYQGEIPFDNYHENKRFMIIGQQ